MHRTTQSTRLVLLTVAVPVSAALGFLSIFLFQSQDTLAWFSLFGVPALLTAAVGLLLRATRAEIAVSAFIASVLGGLTLVGFIAWLSSQGVFD